VGANTMTIKVFKNGKLVKEMKYWDTTQVANYSYIKGREGWFLKIVGGLRQIPVEQVPVNLRMLHMIL
jgi:hypothetical protein